jgi:hypothetical protein
LEEPETKTFDCPPFELTPPAPTITSIELVPPETVIEFF